jgi:hypothetical protein
MVSGRAVDFPDGWGGHQDVTTTMIYTHVLNRGPAGVRSPVDRLLGEVDDE